MAKNLEISLLFDFYKNMLTSKQADIFDLYYNEDLSLAEISENLSISRQAARDAIKHAEQSLCEMEQKLSLYKKHCQITDNIELIRNEIAQLRIKDNNNIKTIDNIKKLLTIIEE